MTPQPTATGWRVDIDPHWPGFAGHFPGDPILPAAELIELGRTCLGREGETLSVIKARFLRAVRPGDLLDIAAAPTGTNTALSFSVAGERTAEVLLG